MKGLEGRPKIVRKKMEVKTGRKLTKLTCDYCDKEMIFDRRKRDKKKAKFMKHIRSHRK